MKGGTYTKILAIVIHSPTILSSNQDKGLIKYCYTFTQCYQAADNSWLVEFKAKDKEVTLKDVMRNDFPVASGIAGFHCHVIQNRSK